MKDDVDGAGQPAKAASMRDLLNDLKDSGKEILSESLKSAKEILQEKTDEVKKKASDINSKSLGDMADGVSGYVKKNPVKSLLIAAGVGLALGYLLKGDKES